VCSGNRWLTRRQACRFADRVAPAERFEAACAAGLTGCAARSVVRSPAGRDQPVAYAAPEGS